MNTLKSGNNKELGAVIRAKRMQLDITQHELASELNITHPTLRNIEKGGFLNFGTLLSVCQRLGISIVFKTGNINIEY